MRLSIPQRKRCAARNQGWLSCWRSAAGSGSGSLIDQSLSPLACPLGKEGCQLLVIALLRLRYHLLAQM
jgi:hypothetical protein